MESPFNQLALKSPFFDQGLSPSLALNFLTGSLDSRITFSRLSNATLTDSTGKITYAPNNLFTYSQEFDNAAWTKLGATVTANSTTAPDGTLTADTLTENTATSTHQIYRLPGLGIATYTYSIYAKANGRTQIQIEQESGGNSRFTLSGSGTAVALGSNTVTITSVGNGWYRCSTTFTVTGAFGVYLALYNGTTANYTGDGVSGVFLWGAQFEAVTYQTTPSTYNATTTAAYYGPRFDYDPVTLAAKGLLIEEARTNLLTYSEQFDNAVWAKTNAAVTPNSITSPSNTLTADLITTSSTADTIQQDVSITSGTTYTFSAYVKDGTAGSVALVFVSGFTGTPYISVNLSTGVITSFGSPLSSSATNVGNGWWRLTITATASTTGVATFRFAADSASAVVTYYLWGAQLETGAFATSYIPTVGGTLQRNADIATMTGTNFSSWFNQGPVNFMVPSNAVTAGTGTTVTANVATSPDGTSNAFRIAKTDATTPRYTTRPAIMNVANNTTYTASAYFKYDGYDTTVSLEYSSISNWGINWIAQFNVTSSGVTAGTTNLCTSTVAPVGNGWYFCTTTFTTTTVTVSSNPNIITRITGASGVTVLGFGGQLEVGSTATTYIPTTTVPVASPPAVGTLYLAYNSFGAAATAYPVAEFNDNTSNNRMLFSYNPTSNARFLVFSNGSAVVNNLDRASVSSVKWANAFQSGSYGSSYNNQATLTNSSSVVVAADRLLIGSSVAGGYANAWISTIKYYRSRLSDSQLQNLTR